MKAQSQSFTKISLTFIGLIIVSTVVMLLIGSWLTTMIDGPKGMNLIILQWFTTIGAMLIPGYWLFKQVKSTGQQGPLTLTVTLSAIGLFSLWMPLAEYAMNGLLGLAEASNISWVQKQIAESAAHAELFGQMIFMPGWAYRLMGALTVILLPAVAEEYFFRGGIQRLLGQVMSHRLALVLTALVFSLAHGLPLQVPYLFAGGLIIGYAYQVTGKLWVPMAAHALHNAIVYGLVVQGGPERLSGDHSMPVLAIVICSLGAIAASYVVIQSANKA